LYDEYNEQMKSKLNIHWIVKSKFFFGCWWEASKMGWRLAQMHKGHSII